MKVLIHYSVAKVDWFSIQNGVKWYTMSTLDWLVQNEYPLLLVLFLSSMIPFEDGNVREVSIVSFSLHIRVCPH